MKKILALVLALAMMLSCSLALADEIPAPKSPLRYSAAGGSSGGNFYVVAAGVASYLNQKLPQYFNWTAEETGGGTANLVMIQNGEAEIGVAMTSSIEEAFKGEADWTHGVQMTNLRGLVPLYPSYLTIYSLASTGAKQLSDLNGKVVGLGSKGAAMDSVFRDAFPKMGITPGSIFNDGHGATATAVGNGQVDVAVLFSLPPFAAIAELEAGKELSFVALSEEEQKFLCDNYSFYSPATMPAGAYKGVTEDLTVVSEWNMMVTSCEVPEDYAYLITKTLLESDGALVEYYKGLVYVTAENMVNFNCPLHAGTVRYLKEIGVDVPAALIPAEYAE